MPTTPFVHIEFRFVGFHRWPDAPDEYAYLRGTHRHEFVVTAEFSVGHADRAVEINACQDFLVARETFVHEIDSCEQIALRIARRIQGNPAQFGPAAWGRVLVQEDGIQGGGVTWEPTVNHDHDPA